MIVLLVNQNVKLEAVHERRTIHFYGADLRIIAETVAVDEGSSAQDRNEMNSPASYLLETCDFLLLPTRFRTHLQTELSKFRFHKTIY